MSTEVLLATEAGAVRRAAEALADGDIVAVPTDTVYGLAVDPTQPKAVARLFALKGRPDDVPLPILVAGPEQVDLVAGALGPAATVLAARFWPGPLTLVVPKHPALPEAVSTLPTVGVRQPDHPVAQALLTLTGPLAVTSANLSGQASATTAEAVLAQLAGRIDLLLDGGPTPGGVASTVIDCTAEPPVILRPGPIGPAEVAAALKR